MPKQPDHAPPYRHVSWCYDAIASAYSLGAIDRAKRHHHPLVQQGDHVLYAGAGRGREIVGACHQGAAVTCVEPCPTTAEALHRKLGASCDGFTIVPRPIQSMPAEPMYDLVVAHFFLNVFDRHAMPGVLEHLTQMVRPGGRIVIADFMPAARDAGLIDRAMRLAYYKPVNIASGLLRICALHPIYDYKPLLIDAGLKIESETGFGLLPSLVPFYSTIIARKPEGP